MGHAKRDIMEILLIVNLLISTCTAMAGRLRKVSRNQPYS